jgi:hypothetical protein
MNRFKPAALFTLVFALFVTLASSAFADPMIYTGESIRTKSVGPFTAKVYSIRHDMKDKPDTKSKQAVIDADTDKMFTWRMLRDVETAKIKKALTEAFAMNGFGDGARIGQFVGAFSQDEIKEDAKVVIFYSAASKSVTITVGGGSKATIAGQDFMKGVWSIWLGKIDQPSMGDQLIAKL